jgi:hypothetical protein
MVVPTYQIITWCYNPEDYSKKHNIIKKQL